MVSPLVTHVSQTHNVKTYSGNGWADSTQGQLFQVMQSLVTYKLLMPSFCNPKISSVPQYDLSIF